MKLKIISTIDQHYWSHGFGILMNKCLGLCYQHFQEFGNWDIEIEDRQLNDVIQFKPSSEKEPDYQLNLVWDGPSETDYQLNAIALMNMVPDIQSLYNPVGAIAVHARGTDKATEIDLLHPAKMAKLVKSKIPVNTTVNLYTDDIRYYLAFSSAMLIYHDSHKARSLSNKPLHNYPNFEKKKGINKSAWKDVCEMGSAMLFFTSNSNLSQLAKSVGVVFQNGKQRIEEMY